MNPEPAGAQDETITLAPYRPGALGARLGFGHRPAVVVVDLINGFTDPGYPPAVELDEVVEQTRALLDQARRYGHPVVFTTIAFRADESAGRVWRRKMPVLQCLTVGSRAVEVDERLGRHADEPVVTKTAASAFHGTGLRELLAAAAVDSIVLAGATTSGCVRASAVDACSAELPAMVVRECVGDRHRGAHLASLFDLDAKYADVVGVQDVSDMLGAARMGVAE
jgi:nicotinamidase-related amidase